jgi:hypothetical protein
MDGWALARAVRRAERSGRKARARAGIDLASDAVRNYHRAAVEWRQLGHRLGAEREGGWLALEFAARLETHAANLEATIESLRLEKIA